VLSQIDILSAVADQLSQEERATIVAMLASERMIQDLQADKIGTVVLATPFTDLSFAVRTMQVTWQGVTSLHAVLTDGDGTADMPQIVVMLRKGEGGLIHPIIEKGFRAKLVGDFSLAVFDAFADLFTQTEDQAAAS
jgi:hypothetical protein